MMMNKRYQPSKLSTLASLLAAISLLLMGGCSSGATSNEGFKNQSNQAPNKMEELRRDVETFARDEGDLGQEAWKRLNGYPKSQLIADLRSIQQNTTKGDSLYVDVAFVLCNLYHEYDPNKQIVVSAFTSKQSRGLAEERLIDRLIRRGDKELLPVLFSAVNKSDGALAEGLAETFAGQIRDDPVSFLIKLSAESPSTRRGIYQILDGALSAEDIELLEKRVSSSRSTSPVGTIGRELLKALRRKQNP
jgi:hypothetical protein